MQPINLFLRIRRVLLGLTLLIVLYCFAQPVPTAHAQQPGALPAAPTAQSELCTPASPCSVGGETAQNQSRVQIAGPPAPAASPAPAQTPRSNGFTLAVIILIGMVMAVIYSVYRILRGINSNQPPEPSRWSRWQSLAVLLLTVAGIGVAGYLTYIEATKVAAVCGPVGDCNSVQSSPYAYLFGVIPVSLLGLLGYVGILVAWLVGEWLLPQNKAYAWLAIFGMALFGTAFSIYLTYLEPFVINAVCIWCLTSAVIIALILVLSAGRAADSLGFEDEDELGAVAE